MWGYKLEFHSIFFNCQHVFCRDFIVQYLNFGFKSTLLQSTDQRLIYYHYFSRLSILHRFNQNAIWVHFDQYHDVLHAPVWVGWKFSCLVGVHFASNFILQVVHHRHTSFVFHVWVGWVVAQNLLPFRLSLLENSSLWILTLPPFFLTGHTFYGGREGVKYTPLFSGAGPSTVVLYRGS